MNRWMDGRMDYWNEQERVKDLGSTVLWICGLSWLQIHHRTGSGRKLVTVATVPVERVLLNTYTPDKETLYIYGSSDRQTFIDSRSNLFSFQVWSKMPFHCTTFFMLNLDLMLLDDPWNVSETITQVKMLCLLSAWHLISPESIFSAHSQLFISSQSWPAMPTGSDFSCLSPYSSFSFIADPEPRAVNPSAWYILPSLSACVSFNHTVNKGTAEGIQWHFR